MLCFKKKFGVFKSQGQNIRYENKYFLSLIYRFISLTASDSTESNFQQKTINFAGLWIIFEFISDQKFWDSSDQSMKFELFVPKEFFSITWEIPIWVEDIWKILEVSLPVTKFSLCSANIPGLGRILKTMIEKSSKIE